MVLTSLREQRVRDKTDREAISNCFDQVSGDIREYSTLNLGPYNGTFETDN